MINLLKIDLHIHTQRCKKGDGSKRNISPENFIKKMHENEVCMCAITNHNKFDLHEFDKIQKLDEELVIFPGIELDVISEKNQSHIVLICDPSCKEAFYKTFDNHSNRNYDTFTLSENDFFDKVKQFNSDDIIVIPHFLDKDKERSIDFSFKNRLEEKLSDYVVILEPGKLATMGIINAHKELAIIGSDVKDWSTYSSSNLPEIKFKIETFKKFVELAKDGTLLIKSLLDNAHSETIYFDGGEISIFNDINIIFGEKGSGKTKLIEQELIPYYEESGKKFIFHKGSEYKEKYTDILNNKIERTIIDEETSEDIAILFDKISHYKERNISNFIKTYIECSKKKSNGKNKNLLRKTASTFSSSGVEFSEIKRQLNSKLSKINKVEQLNKSEKRDHAAKDRLSTELINLKQHIYSESEKDFKNSFVNASISDFLTTIKGSVDKKTGTKSKPNNIGFSNLVAKRLERYKWNIEINQLLDSIQSDEKYKLGYLPGKGIVYLTTKVMVLSDEVFLDSPFNKSTIVQNRELMKKLRNFSLSDSFTGINNYFKSNEKYTGEQFVNQVIRVYPEPSKQYPDHKPYPGMTLETKDSSTPYNPSEGEKSILSIVAILENTEYDCYLFDEMERGLGNKYIASYVIPALKRLRDIGKTLIVSTHNANIAISTLPSQSIYCRYPDQKGYYMTGNMYSNQLINFKNASEIVLWEPLAIEHLEGNETMFLRRKNIWNY